MRRRRDAAAQPCGLRRPGHTRRTRAHPERSLTTRGRSSAQLAQRLDVLVEPELEFISCARQSRRTAESARAHGPAPYARRGVRRCPKSWWCCAPARDRWHTPWTTSTSAVAAELRDDAGLIRDWRRTMRANSPAHRCSCSGCGAPLPRIARRLESLRRSGRAGRHRLRACARARPAARRETTPARAPMYPGALARSSPTERVTHTTRPAPRAHHVARSRARAARRKALARRPSLEGIVRGARNAEARACRPAAPSTSRDRPRESPLSGARSSERAARAAT